MVEIIYALEESLRIVDGYSRPVVPYVDVTPEGETGHGASEAPRGLLYHRYDIDGDGKIADAHIVPPTSQNQGRMEEDLRQFLRTRIHLPKDQLTLQCEQSIRNYDPCISCATHFLRLELDR